jgi:predicted phage terminase large subunit-like protein
MVASPSYPMLKDATFRSFMHVGSELMNRIIKYRGSGGNLWAKIATFDPDTNPSSGTAEVIFRTASDPDKLRGPNLSGVWLDEAAIMRLEAFEIAIATLREGGDAGWITMTSTPKGKSHWTYEQLYDKNGNIKPFTEVFRSKQSDNPMLNQTFVELMKTQYADGSRLSRQELGGEFIDFEGLLFRREWFDVIREVPTSAYRIRYWDKAATAANDANKDTCWTAGVLMAKTADNKFYIEDVVRGQWSYAERNAVIRQTAEIDSVKYNGTVNIWIEMEPGSGGKESAFISVSELSGYPVFLDRPQADKATRAIAMSSQAEIGNVKIRAAHFTEAFLEEVSAFPEGRLKDQCLAEGTMISTSNGQVPIEDVSVGDLVLTRFGFFPVSWSGCTGSESPVLKLLAKDGSFIESTTSHPIFTKERGFLRLGTIAGMFNISGSCENENQKSKSSFSMGSHSGDTLNQELGVIESTITPQGLLENQNRICTEQFGLQNTEKFQPGASFIMSMKTRLTTRSTTSNALQTLNTREFTRKAVDFRRQRSESILQRLGISRKRGTLQKKGEHCMLKMEKSRCSSERKKSLSVKSVEINSNQRTLEQNSAQRGVANSVAIGRLGLQISLLVNSVEKNSSAQAEVQLNAVLVPVAAVLDTGTKKRVFNLAIDGPPEFFANGILVHNCDAAVGAFNKLALGGVSNRQAESILVYPFPDARQGSYIDSTSTRLFEKTETRSIETANLLNYLTKR